MIITKKVLIIINNQNRKKYLNKGYIGNIGDIIEVDIKDIAKYSLIRINSKCDVCGIEKELSYSKYNKNISNSGYYVCSEKCSLNKKRETCLKKYGVDNQNKVPSIKEIGNKTCLKKYGNKCSLHSKEINEKTIKTNIIKYGVDNPFKNEEVKNRIKKTNLEKYGVDNPSKNQEIKDKIEETNLKKYGVKYFSQTKKCIEKIKTTKIKNGSQLPDEFKTPYQLYESKVACFTYASKTKLFKNWNGFDYYDNEYIKDNFKLDSENAVYPTIDHKISIFHGFKNNISAEIIGSIDNLCITKRSINSSKGRLTEAELISKLKTEI